MHIHAHTRMHPFNPLPPSLFPSLNVLQCTRIRRRLHRFAHIVTASNNCEYVANYNLFNCKDHNPPLTSVPDNIPNTTVFLHLSGNAITEVKVSDFADLSVASPPSHPLSFLVNARALMGCSAPPPPPPMMGCGAPTRVLLSRLASFLIYADVRHSDASVITKAETLRAGPPEQCDYRRRSGHL